MAFSLHCGPVRRCGFRVALPRFPAFPRAPHPHGGTRARSWRPKRYRPRLRQPGKAGYQVALGKIPADFGKLHIDGFLLGGYGLDALLLLQDGHRQQLPQGNSGPDCRWLRRDAFESRTHDILDDRRHCARPGRRFARTPERRRGGYQEDDDLPACHHGAARHPCRHASGFYCRSSVLPVAVFRTPDPVRQGDRRGNLRRVRARVLHAEHRYRQYGYFRKLHRQEAFPRQGGCKRLHSRYCRRPCCGCHHHPELFRVQPVTRSGTRPYLRHALERVLHDARGQVLRCCVLPLHVVCGAFYPDSRIREPCLVLDGPQGLQPQEGRLLEHPGRVYAFDSVCSRIQRACGL